MRTRTSRAGVVLGAVAVVLLSGCGAAGMHPGAAAVAGEEKITLAEADRFARDFCELNREALRSQGQRVSMAEVRSVAVQLLVRDALVRQFAEEQGLEPGRDYRRAVAGIDDELANVPEGSEEVYREFREDEEFARSIFRAVGERELPGASEQDALAAGQQAFEAWSAEQDVAVDPRFGESTAEGFQPAGQSLSVPVSEQGRLGATSPEPGQRRQDYALNLPDDQVCA